MRAPKTTRLASLVSLTLFLSLMCAQSSDAVQVWLTDVPGYGYNSAAYVSGGRYVGCGPTAGVMILDTYDNRLATPGTLVPDPLPTAWDLHHNYMGTDAGGFGAASDMHWGLENYASDHGCVLDAVVHVEPTTYNPADWPYGPADLAADATFWNTSTWDILVDPFLDFIAMEIDAGDPVMLTVDSDADGGTDHWLVGVGYDRDLGQWAGYNTWDSSLHWYNVQSGFIAGNTMGVGFVRTFDFTAGGCDVDDYIPAPGAFLLGSIGAGLAGWLRRRRTL